MEKDMQCPLEDVVAVQVQQALVYREELGHA
jgi:hypothetical protein